MDIENAQMYVGAYIQSTGPAFTYIMDKKVIGCGGIHEMWNGVGEAWLILGKDVIDYRVTTMRHIMREFPKILNGYHRVQAHVLQGFEKGIQFIESLGFVTEGKALQYGPNRENYIRYSILR